jgi:hypothetical protein
MNPAVRRHYVMQVKRSSNMTPGDAALNLDGRFGPGLAPTWQLLPQEVVVVAGCTPPMAATRCWVYGLRFDYKEFWVCFTIIPCNTINH